MIIGGIEYKEDSAVIIIAEAGINHDGDINQAFKMIETAKEAGADIVKFQLFSAKKMYSVNAGQYTTALGKKENIIDILRAVEIDKHWVMELQSYCDKIGIGFLCTVCDLDGVDLLEECGVDSYKIASNELIHIPLLKKLAHTNKTIILSTAGAYLSDVDKSIRTIEAEGNHNVVLMHCVSKYPTPLNECNLGILKTFRHAFPNAVIGYSDHTEDPIKAPCFAVMNGARIIEKHFTLDKNLPGADHSFSLNPKELKLMCEAIRTAEIQLKNGANCDVNDVLYGTTQKRVLGIENDLREYAYRTIVATESIKMGERLSSDNIDVLRPGNEEQGLHPEMYEIILGCKAVSDIEVGKSIKWENILQK